MRFAELPRAQSPCSTVRKWKKSQIPISDPTRKRQRITPALPERGVRIASGKDCCGSSGTLPVMTGPHLVVHAHAWPPALHSLVMPSREPDRRKYDAVPAAAP